MQERQPIRQTALGGNKRINAITMTPIFDGTVKEGKLFLDKSDKFKEYLFGLTDKRVQVTVEKLKHNRTNGQNRYYWGVVVKLIAQHTGHDTEQVHELLKQLFSPKWCPFVSTASRSELLFGDLAIPTSTARLDTIAFAEYTEKCRMWANEFLGLNVPLPDEVAA